MTSLSLCYKHCGAKSRDPGEWASSGTVRHGASELGTLWFWRAVQAKRRESQSRAPQFWMPPTRRITLPWQLS